MIENDTVKLLRECDAGIKMGIAAIDEVVGSIRNNEFKEILEGFKKKHEKLECELNELLQKYGDSGKEPPMAARGMSWLKTNAMLMINESDGAISALMTDGCDMGIKSLSKYLNKYKAADEASKSVAKRIIGTEESMVRDIRKFL